MDTSILFEPIQIGKIELKNRIAMSPMNMGYTGQEGYASEQTNAWYATRARGGFGLIITECVVANPYPWRGSDSLNPLLLDSQNKYRQLSQLADVIHSYKGTKVFMQLSPGWGRQGHPDLEHESIASGAPSAIPMEMDLRKLNKGWAKQVKRMGIRLIDELGGVEKIQRMFGGNLAGLLGIDPSARRIGQASATATTTTPVTLATPNQEMAALKNTYEVVVSSPMGELPGKAVVKVDGNSLSGSLSLLNHDNPFSGGSFEDGKVTFKGELKTPIGKMAYTVTGTLIEGKIEAVAKTKMGELLIRSK